MGWKSKDVDKGWRRLQRNTAKLAKTRHRVGVFDPAVARYAIHVEGRTPFLRPAADESDPGLDRAAAKIADAIDKDPAGAAEAFAEAHADRVRKNIEDRGLIDTGALLASIEVRRDD